MNAQDYRVANLVWAGATLVFMLVTSVALGLLARQIARWRGATPATQRRVFLGYAFAGPWIIGFIIFVVGPSLVSLYYSFTNYKLGDPVQWIGMENYRTLLVGTGTEGRQFSQAMFNSFYYALIGVPLQIVLALGMAMLLNREIPGIRVFRTIFYLPVILAGGPAILLAWRYMLSANGGFVNVALQKFAQTFFVFGFLYRLFIFLMGSFNGFYSGLTRGDPVGPLVYTLPAVIGFVLILLLALGDWSETKRVRAWRAAQMIGLVVLFTLAFRGLVADPVDPSWTYFSGVLVTGFIIVNVWQHKMGLVKLWQVGALILFALTIILTLVQSGEDKAPYLIALVAAASPIVVSLFGQWDRRKMAIVMGMVGLLCLVMFIRAIPGQLDGGQLAIFPRYLTLQSTLEHPDDANYLKTTYIQQSLSPLWIYGLVAGSLVLGALLNTRYPRARRIFLYGALIFFALFAVSSALDGRAYFQAYQDIAQATGKPNYHFTLFRSSVENFPDQKDVPLWMNNELWTKPSLVLITVWSAGTGMLIFLAALKGVPRTLYEAAQVDGASKIQQFFSITLPMISPAMFYNIVIGLVAALQTFDTIFIISRPETTDSLRSAAFFLYQRTFTQLHIGEGAAVSWILAAIILTVTALQFRFSNWVYYEV